MKEECLICASPLVYFEEDKEIKESVKVTEEDTMTTLLEKTRAYWGWSDS